MDIAEQHHGTSLLKFFYYKAKEKGDQITEKEFRYPGPKPQSKEAAIISVADSVEAAVRSMHNPNPERIENWCGELYPISFRTDNSQNVISRSENWIRSQKHYVRL